MNTISSSRCRIFIDADACPVRTETVSIAIRNKIEVYIVSNGGIRPSANPMVKIIRVTRLENAKKIIMKIYQNDLLT